MPFDPKDFSNLAFRLVQQNQDEASLRTAISRVYYAAHHIALERLTQKGWQGVTGTGADHDNVIRELRARKFRTQGDRLKLLLELREHADYHLDSVSSIKNARCALCNKIRNANKMQTVDKDHWAEASALTEACLPLLLKI